MGPRNQGQIAPTAAALIISTVTMFGLASEAGAQTEPSNVSHFVQKLVASCYEAAGEGVRDFSGMSSDFLHLQAGGEIELSFHALGPHRTG